MRSNFLYYIFMHAGFLLYSFYTVLGKKAAEQQFFSKSFFIFYLLVLLVLFLYAIIWQQVLKHIKLSIATANKAITVIWGMLWGCVIFQETISVKKILGATLIIIGILLLTCTERKKHE